MDKFVEFSLAKEILAEMIAKNSAEGFDPSDPIMIELFEDEKKLNEYDRETIDKIMNVYAPLIKVGESHE